MRAQLIFALSIAGLFACGNDDKGPSALGGSCGDVDECQPGLSCEFGQCQQPCNADSDCPGEERCVVGLVDVNGTAGHICQLPENTRCTAPVQCAGRQVCGMGECRDECTNNASCTSGQLCTLQKTCASMDPNKDHVDSAGNLLP